MKLTISIRLEGYRDRQFQVVAENLEGRANRLLATFLKEGWLLEETASDEDSGLVMRLSLSRQDTVADRRTLPATGQLKGASK